MTFEDAYELTNRISSETAFSREESRAMFDQAMSVNTIGTVLEVGCEFGRSTSLLAQVAAVQLHELVLVEPTPRPELMAMLARTGALFTLHAMQTIYVPEELLPVHIDLLHIDGDHSAGGIEEDCKRLLHRVRPGGGVVCFHDYGRDSLPDVKEAVDRHLYYPGSERFWETIGTFETLHVVRRWAKE